MFTNIIKLFAARKNCVRRSTARKPLQPVVECLDSRDVPSTSSAAPHAVATPNHPNQDDVFYIDQVTGALKDGPFVMEHWADVTSLSAGHDAVGDVDVFVTIGGNSFWKWDQGRWTELPGNLVKSFAAVDGGRAYAIFSDGSLNEYNGFGWIRMTGSHTVAALDAVTSKSGRDSVFVLATDTSFWEYDATSSNARSFVSERLHLGGAINHVIDFSAGTDALGNADVYATIQVRLGITELFENHHANSGGWHFVTMGYNYHGYSATDNGAVWMIAPKNGVVELDRYGHKLHSLSNVAAASISAASSTDVYFTSTDHSINEWVRVGGSVFQEFSDLGHSM
jgi:hypothetical protein